MAVSYQFTCDFRPEAYAPSRDYDDRFVMLKDKQWDAVELFLNRQLLQMKTTVPMEPRCPPTTTPARSLKR